MAGLFFTLLVVYMLINWLPMLLVGQGFRASQAAGVMFSLQIGAACGTLLLGALMDKLTPLRMSLPDLQRHSGVAVGAGQRVVADWHAAGGVCRRAVRHRLDKGALRSGAAFYPAAIRATGVGTAVAVGRLGAMSGPLLAGKMLALGTGTVGGDGGLGAGHCELAGVAAAFWLMHRQQRAAMV